MKTREKILEYVRKKPMATAEQITGELGINYESVRASLSTLERKGKVKATDSSPARYVVLPKKPIRGDDGQGFMDYVDGLSPALGFQALRVSKRRLDRALVKNKVRRGDIAWAA